MNTDFLTKDMVFFTALIREFAPGSILGGGALRDLHNGRPVKDIDIFVPANTDWWELEKLVSPYYPKVGVDVTQNYLPNDATITRATEFLTYDSSRLPLNVIAIKEGLSPLDRMDQFDFGLCQLAYDGSVIHSTEAYWQDVLQHTITVTRSENVDQFARTMRRFDRLSRKYEGWTLAVPEKFWALQDAYMASKGDWDDLLGGLVQ